MAVKIELIDAKNGRMIIAFDPGAFSVLSSLALRFQDLVDAGVITPRLSDSSGLISPYIDAIREFRNIHGVL